MTIHQPPRKSITVAEKLTRHSSRADSAQRVIVALKWGGDSEIHNLPHLRAHIRTLRLSSELSGQHLESFRPKPISSDPFSPSKTSAGSSTQLWHSSYKASCWLTARLCVWASLSLTWNMNPSEKQTQKNPCTEGNAPFQLFVEAGWIKQDN